MTTTFTLRPAYKGQGIINLKKEHLEAVGEHMSEIQIYLGDAEEPITGKLYTKNPHVPRLSGGRELVRWFQNFQFGQVLKVTIINPSTFRVHP
ncbi:hypothetical protein [Arcticibacter sp. MXS-1]|uniref:hypothetical protein n=1 Tax=Arcticibacter sp. MXS-1 TaxID=3341726 RepID=UPI0035A9584E